MSYSEKFTRGASRRLHIAVGAISIPVWSILGATHAILGALTACLQILAHTRFIFTEFVNTKPKEIGSLDVCSGIFDKVHSI